MGLKDVIQADLSSVFFNTDEFAETHNIDGHDMPVIVDNDRLMERSKKEYDGISVGEILYYASVSDFSKQPEIGMPQIFNGRIMYISDVREDDGVYEIILHQNQGE